MSQDRFDWQSCVRAHSEPGLSSCVEDGRLTLDGRRVAATTIDLYALRLVEWAVEREQSLILCPPEPFGAIPALAAAAAHIASIVSHHATTGKAMGSSRRVAVVTTDPRLRGVYRRLGIGTASLFEVAPAAVRTASGAISVIGHDPGRGWSTVFLTRPGEVTKLDRVDLTVVELPVAEESDLEQLDGPLVLIARDPADPMVARLAERLPVFAWSDADLASLPNIALVDGPALVEDRLRLERAAQGISCNLVAVPEQRVCENAALFWADIGPLLRAARRSPFGRELAAAAFFLFYDLMHLAVPAEFYEASTRPLRARIREIEIAQRLVSGDLKDLYVPMIAMELQDLAAAIAEGSKKSNVMRGLLRDCASEGADVLLVARTAELARVYRSYIDSVDDLDGRIRVASIRGIAEEPPADLAVITGLLPRYARYLYTTGIAAEIVALGYEAESPLGSVPDGFTEHRQMESALAYQLAYSEWLARDAAKSACWSMLSGDPVSIPDDHPEPPRVSVNPASDDAEAARPPEAPPGLWDGAAGGLVGLERRLARDAAPRLSAEGGEDGLEVEALQVEFSDGRWMYVDGGASVTRWSSQGARAEAGYSAERIAPGDELLLLDGEVRKDLLGKVLEVAEDVPELAAPAAWVDYWRDALRRAHHTFESYEALHEELERHGCSKQTQTVRLWVVGQTIGPEDPEDVRRLGECLGDRSLTENYQRVAEAMRSLRTAHQRLGRRLGELMRDVGGATAVGTIKEDEIIDERTGLAASDFRDSIEILAVASVRPAGAPVPYVLTGSLRAADEKETEVA
jgi:hypothetical protein